LSEGEGEGRVSIETCFYICPIGKIDSPTRKRSNQVYKHVVAATLEPLGYTVVRADHMEQSGLITSQIIDGLLSSDLLVADLTDHNPNVYYELAIRHAVRKPFIQLIAEDQTLPFDIQGLRTITLDYRDLDSVFDARQTLTGMVSGIRSGKPVETPLTYAINIKSLEESGDSEARGIADIISEIKTLKQLIRVPSGQSGEASKRSLSSAQADIATLVATIGKLVDAGQITAEAFLEIVARNYLNKAVAERLMQIWTRNFPDEPPF
jgi:hypothetical protein